MVKDFCAICGSKDLKMKVRELEFKFPNPGTIVVSQECEECQSCGEKYFDSKQISELSTKIAKAKKELESNKQKSK